MVIFNEGGNLNDGVIVNQIIAALKAHRSALELCNEKFAWTSGISLADLTAAPFSMTSTGAQQLLTAVADAHAEYLTHITGLPPGTYPQPSSAYVYAASQDAVIGPN